jgi:hypothetical protein
METQTLKKAPEERYNLIVKCRESFGNKKPSFKKEGFLIIWL